MPEATPAPSAQANTTPTQSATPPGETSALKATATPPPVLSGSPKSPTQRALDAWDKVRMDAEAKKSAAAAVKPEAPKAEPPRADATPAAPPVTPKEEEPLSAKFAQVAKLERQARESLKQMKLREEAVAKREAESAQREKALEAKKLAAKTNPDAWLSEAGLSYDDVATWKLNGGKATAELEVAALRQQLEADKKAQGEAQSRAEQESKHRAQAEHQAKYTAWAKGVVDTVKANASTYELINTQGAHKLVPAVIQKQFEDTGRVLTTEEAAALVEKHLEQQVEKLLQSKKLAARVAPPQSPAAPAQPSVTPSPTLTNGLTASASSGGRPLTWAEKKQRALQAMAKAKS